MTSTIVTQMASVQSEPGRTDLVSPAFNATVSSYEVGTFEYHNVTNRTPACVPERNLYTISFQVLLIPSLVFNLLLFVAATIDRVKLRRQNYLFASVISTLLSNILYMIFFEWILLDNYFEDTVEESLIDVITPAKYVWAFLESATVAMPFLICGNIVCLTYVTVSSATYVGRVANTEDTAKAAKRFTKIKRVTLALIVTSWTVPLLLTVVGMAAMNCVDKCKCHSTNFISDLCPNQHHCSKFWAPVTKTYLWVNVGLWFVAITSLCVLVGYAIVKYQRTTRGKKKVAIPDQAISDEEIHLEYRATNNNGIQTSQISEVKPKSQLKRKRTRRSFRHRLNSRLRFALILTVIYVICSACFAIAFSLDSSAENPSPFLLFALSRIAMYLYTTACPIIMVQHLPILKSSLSNLFHKLKTCCKSKSPERSHL